MTLLLACASPSVATAPLDAPTPVATPRASTVASVPDAAPRTTKNLGTLSAPQRALCTLEPDTWTGTVSLRRDGAPFATVSSVPATITLAADGEERWAMASVDAQRLSLRGVTTAPPLFLKRPTALGGFLLPNADTSLRWDEVAGATNAVAITFETAKFFQTPPLLKEQVPCTELTIAPRQYDPRTLLRAEKLDSVGIVGGGVELRLSPNTPPVATTKAGSRAGVFVLKAGKDFSRVLLDIDDGYAFGWIGSNHINRGSLNGGRIGIGRAGVAYSHYVSNQCARDLELVAEVGGERASVGALLAGIPFKLGPADEPSGLTAVSFDLGWLRLSTGATLWVPTSELAGCDVPTR